MFSPTAETLLFEGYTAVSTPSSVIWLVFRSWRFWFDFGLTRTIWFYAYLRLFHRVTGSSVNTALPETLSELPVIPVLPSTISDSTDNSVRPSNLNASVPVKC